MKPGRDLVSLDQSGIGGRRPRGGLLPAGPTKPRAARGLLFALAVAAHVTLVATAGALAIAIIYVLFVPYPLSRLRGPEAAVLVDRTGEILRERPGPDGSYRYRVALSEIDPLVAAATVAVEDERFWSHPGVDPLSVVRAGLSAVRAGRLVSGASTLTMQLARTVRPRGRNLWGKVREMLDALRIERAVGKEAVLEAYLNLAPYGPRVAGVEAAARLYFGKSAAHLSAAEAAFLAGLPQSPVGFNPWKYPDRAKVRARFVLHRMVEEGVLAEEDRVRAELELAGLTVKPETHPLGAPHYVVRALAAAPEGARWLRGTIDLALQIEVETALREELVRIAAFGVREAAAVVLDNATGDVLAWVGSPDFFSPDGGQVDGVLAPRQPGSTLKPFVFALALEAGKLTAASVLPDVPTEFADTGLPYVPRNFDGRSSGPVRVREALSASLNIPAVKAASLLGADELLRGLRAFGFRSLSMPASHYGLALALGDGEVTLLELAAAYAALARGGVPVTPRLLLEARDDGAVLPTAADPAPAKGPVSAEAAAVVADILADRAAGMSALAPGGKLGLDVPVAVKTGTSTGYRDRWTVGFSARVTVAIWVGNFDGGAAPGLAAAAGAAPLFARVMAVASRRHPGATASPVPTAPGLEHGAVCSLSGLRPGPDCPHPIDEKFLPGTVPAAHCTMHGRVAIDVRNGLRAGHHCPAAFVREVHASSLPDLTYDVWLADPDSAHEATRFAPEAWSPLCPPGPADVPLRGRGTWLASTAHAGLPEAAAAVPHIISPRPGARYVIDAGKPLAAQAIPLRAAVPGAPASLVWIVDGRVVADAVYPYGARFALTPGMHEVIATDGVTGAASAPVVFEVR